MYQEILSTESGVRVNNIVSFGPTIGQLKVGAPSLALKRFSSADTCSVWAPVTSHVAVES